MAWAGLSLSKTDVPFREEPGAESLVFPGVFPVERKRLLAPCSGCSKAAAHAPCDLIGAPIPFGETRHQRIPEANRLDIATAHAINSALWIAGYIHQPIDTGELRWNAGQANNQSQFIECRIAAASGNTLTVVGPNPKRIALGQSVPNPDWPGDGGRFETETFECALPVGALCRFLEPSVLAPKLRPFVTRIIPPATNAAGDATWSVELSADVSNAMRPLDLKFPGATYHCRFYWHAFVPPRLPNWQVPEETAFTRHVRVVSRDELEAASGIVDLLNTQGAATRVLYPSHFPDSFAVVSVGLEAVRSAAWIEARLATTQSAFRTWTTTLDLSDALDDEPTAEAWVLAYMPEATGFDAWRLQMPSGCGNCQEDRSESYSHHDGWRCTRPTDADQFATFRRSCWQPDCSGFALGYVGSAIGTLTRGADDARDPSWWAPPWTRASWILEQAMESFGFFSLTFPSGGGPSLEALVGGWSDSVPTGKFPSRTPLYGAAFGQRETFTDSGGENHRLIHGLFQARGEWTAGTTPDYGAAPVLVDGWTARNDALGFAMPARLRQFASRGVGRTHLYDWTSSAGGLQMSNRLEPDQASYATGIDLTEAEDATLAAIVRARF